tara:strand:- start:31 stop:288 length:258 start_codon:yes stop_codon:yes gene_type:complete
MYGIATIFRKRFMWECERREPWGVQDLKVLCPSYNFSPIQSEHNVCESFHFVLVVGDVKDGHAGAFDCVKEQVANILVGFVVEGA